MSQNQVLDRLAVTADMVKLLATIVRDIVARTDLLKQNATIEDAKGAAAIVNEAMNSAPGKQGAPAHDMGGGEIGVVCDASAKSDGTADDAAMTPAALSEQVEKLQSRLREIREARGSGD